MNLDVDADEFALAWRAGYKPAMQEVMDRGEWIILDDLHRRILDRVLDDFGLTALGEAERQHLNRVWHRLEPWPDSVEGLTRLKSALHHLYAVQRQYRPAHRNGQKCRPALGLHSLRRDFPQVQTAPGHLSRRSANLRLEPRQVMLAAAHHGDLEHARNCGLQTAYIERPFEYGRDNPKPVAPWDANSLHNTSIIHLAEQLGC